MHTNRKPVEVLEPSAARTQFDRSLTCGERGGRAQRYDDGDDIFAPQRADNDDETRQELNFR